MAVLHKRKILAGMLIGMMVLAGCNGAAKVPDEIEQTSLVIDKDGKVTSHMVDLFEKEHYDLEELRKMATQEVAAYNTSNQMGTEAPVTVKEVKKASNSKVLVTYQYDSANTYAHYNNATLFYGTVAEAKEAGYNFDSLNQVLFSANGKKSKVSSELNDSDLSKKHIVLLAESTRVYCPYKVSYVSESAFVKEDGSVDTTAMLPEEYPVIILLDK